MLTAGTGEAPSQSDGLLALTTHLAVSLSNHEARTRLHASQRQIVHRLQEALLPPPPPIEQTDLGRFYTGAENQHSTGGDLYDWLVLPSGSLHFCIVDVMGKGVAASKDAAAVTHVLRLLVLDGCPLGNVMRRADSILTLQNPELVATAIVGRYDPATGKAELAGAGHPPALLVSGGQATAVEAPGIPIGWPGAGSDGTTSFTLDTTASLVLYTDGLVESGRDILAGMEALARHAVQTNEYPAEHQARALVERALEGAARYDDSLALVIRRRATAEGPVRALGPFRHPIGASAASIPLARHLLNDWLRWQPVSDADRSDLLLAASELCTNALRHSSGEGWTATLRAWVEDLDVVIGVDDADPTPVDLRAVDEIPDTDALSGRGLFLVQALTDGIEVEARDGGKRVTCRKRNAVSQQQPIGG
jgi:serine phosphatase RsbU (regulator of sigma subunit)/anti-sigma regulatory factor (Ser/Thr protein kinase)